MTPSGISSFQDFDKRLLTEHMLTLPRALEISTGMEAAAQNAKGFQESDSLIVKPVKHSPHQMHGQKRYSGTRQQSQPSASRYSMPSCKHCGKSNHSEAVCRFKHANCHKCGKKGYIAPICRSTGNPRPGNSGSQSRGRNKLEHYLT